MKIFWSPKSCKPLHSPFRATASSLKKCTHGATQYMYLPRDENDGLLNNP
ncbi:MAG: hypothetical protein KAI83_17350 [Thiomargarita sp.]|nr:hypothetical protein [Thiomargarita sp.]